MGYIPAGGLSDDVPPGVPLIGWHNLVTFAGIETTTEDADFPATNLANPATHLKWVAGVDSGDEHITIEVDSSDPIDYVGVARHNWFSAGAIVSIETLDSPAVELIAPQLITNDDPLLFRFSPQVLSGVVIKLELGGATGGLPPEAAVIYVGKLLVLERGITIGQPHVPITYGRRTNVVSGMSESGNFLGRIIVGEHRESTAEFEWFRPDFYRSDIDAFLEAAQEFPFFWVWSPSDYPGEVGYVWLTNNAEPETDSATDRVALTLEMRGIAS